jgi:hypothetical protein
MKQNIKTNYDIKFCFTISYLFHNQLYEAIVLFHTDSISYFVQKYFKKFNFRQKNRVDFAFCPKISWMWWQNGDMDLSKNMDIYYSWDKGRPPFMQKQTALLIRGELKRLIWIISYQRCICSVIYTNTLKPQK